MSDFDHRAKSFLRDVSTASVWMMKRNVATDHWWRPTVLTNTNLDNSKRPIFDDQTARDIFKELEKRQLLVRIEGNANLNGSDESAAYLMTYNLDGWDKAVSDGRWICAKWIKVKREWPDMIIAFLGGVVVLPLLEWSVRLIGKVIGL